MLASGVSSPSPRLLLPPAPAVRWAANPSLSPRPPPPAASRVPLSLMARRSQRPAGLRARTSKWASQAQWEDPDDGLEGEEEEDDGEDGGAGDASADAHHTLVQEVELLLGPQEKAIFQKHEIPDLGKISTLKWVPFHTLGLSGQVHFMDKLLERGTDINSLDKDGFTALHKAVIGKKEVVISHLLRKGANPHVRDRDGATPLHHAVQVGAMQTVKLLIKYKVDINVADKDGWTPLHVAMQSRSRDIAKVLLVNGADKTRRNKDGKTPLDLSLCYGKDFKSYELAKLLKLVPANRGI